MARQDIRFAYICQGIGIAVLVVVVVMSPSLIFLVRNATLTLQVTKNDVKNGNFPGIETPWIE